MRAPIQVLDGLAVFYGCPQVLLLVVMLLDIAIIHVRIKHILNVLL